MTALRWRRPAAILNEPGQTMRRTEASRRPAPDWVAIRRLYETGDGTVAEITSGNGVTVSALRRRRVAEGWSPRSARPPPKTSGPRTDRNRKKNRPSSKQALLGRLLKVVDQNLKLMERQMNADEPGTAADRERDTRAIGTLTRTVSKITELQAETDASADAARKRQSGTVPDADDTDRLRLEIAERILKLREHHNAR